MANFSSFFPVVGGGGGFTKMKKYVTTRSGDDATDKLPLSGIDMRSVGDISGGGQTSITLKLNQNDADKIAITSAVNGLVGYTFSIGYGVQTVTANTGGAYQVNQTVSFTPAVAGGVGNNTTFNMLASSSFTVNPATDLGLSDGDSLGYMLVGAGYATTTIANGKSGGRIIQGTAIISNASTDLVLTPGAANGGNSTISGGLTLSSGDGIRFWGGRYNGSSSGWSASTGIMGYGVGGTGGGNYSGITNGIQDEDSNHGWGAGAFNATGTSADTAYDGAILLFY